MDVRQRIERYLKRSGMTPTRFGKLAVNDPRLVFDLRKGRHLGAAITARVGAFLDGRAA